MQDVGTIRVMVQRSAMKGLCLVSQSIDQLVISRLHRSKMDAKGVRDSCVYSWQLGYLRIRGAAGDMSTIGANHDTSRAS